VTAADRPDWAAAALAPLGADRAAPDGETTPRPAPLLAFLTSGPALLRRWVLAEALGEPAPGLRWFARARRPGPRRPGEKE